MKAKPSRLLKATFTLPVQTYLGKVAEVRLGATRKEGGTRARNIVIGGETAPAFCTFESPTPHPPVVAVDVFDMEVSLPRAVKMHVKEVIGDSAEWAKLAVDRFDADLVTVHLVSTDPLNKDTSPRQAVKTVESVAQAVDVPLIIGGCGDPAKDMKVFEAVAEAFAGERLLMSSVTRDMDIDRCAQFIKKHGHVVLSFTPMDLSLARGLNHRLRSFLADEDIVMDLTTAALGYGLEYAFSNMERARLSALAGDKELAYPMSSGAANGWAAREAWMEMGQEWEPRETRGPLWELVTALPLLLVGTDLFMMMHPAAVKALKDVAKQLTSPTGTKADNIADWISTRIASEEGATCERS